MEAYRPVCSWSLHERAHAFSRLSPWVIAYHTFIERSLIPAIAQCCPFNWFSSYFPCGPTPLSSICLTFINFLYFCTGDLSIHAPTFLLQQILYSFYLCISKCPFRLLQFYLCCSCKFLLALPIRNLRSDTKHDEKLIRVYFLTIPPLSASTLFRKNGQIYLSWSGTTQ